MIALYLLIGAILTVLIGIGCMLKMPPHMHARRRRVQKRLVVMGHSMARKYTLPNKVSQVSEYRTLPPIRPQLGAAKLTE